MKLQYVKLVAAETLREAVRSPNFWPLVKSSASRGAILFTGQLDRHRPCDHCHCVGFVEKRSPDVVKDHGTVAD